MNAPRYVVHRHLGIELVRDTVENRTLPAEELAGRLNQAEALRNRVAESIAHREAKGATVRES